MIDWLTRPISKINFQKVRVYLFNGIQMWLIHTRDLHVYNKQVLLGYHKLK